VQTEVIDHAGEWVAWQELPAEIQAGQMRQRLPWPNGSMGEIRATASGRFAVVEIDGPRARVVKLSEQYAEAARVCFRMAYANNL
jgi:hypothetical protein